MNQKNSTWEAYKFLKPSFPRVSNPTILAFSCYFHDSSACIIKDGKLVAAADEERFSRKKHDASFPVQAVKYCLEAADTTEVDYVVFYENPAVKWERIEEVLLKNPPPRELEDDIREIWGSLKSCEKIQETFVGKIGLDKKIIFLDHHLCHAASSFFVSGFEKATVVTIDGVGEKVTTSYGIGEGHQLELHKCINFPHSLGLIYTAITVFLGFKANDHEYKVMGLAPYGLMNRVENKFYNKLSQVIDLKPDGSFSLDMKYFGHEHFGQPAFTASMIQLLGIEPRTRYEDVVDDHKNLAAALQMLIEDSVFHILNYIHSVTQVDNLCLAGGVALNSVLNGKILSKTPFKKIFIQPSAGDSGTVVGAAKYIQHTISPLDKVEHINHSSYGPEFTSEYIKDFLDRNEIKYEACDTFEGVIEKTAILLEGKKVIGWFQGRMEWGPRALGNRSILASPLDQDMQDVLNSKVKHRELFRPFAPVICIEDAADYFECDSPIPEPTDYMLMVYPIKEHLQSKIPAVTHVDGSGRLQTIRRHQNHLYYSLIKKFGELTKVPILVNTSFNIRGEAIVCSPEDAFRCMMGTEIDYLVIDKYIIARNDNLSFSWEPVICD
jgi:carbamoyltransferase